MENENYMADEVRGNTGVNVARCYQCGKCSAGCATAPEMDYPPSLVLRMLQTRSEENDRAVCGFNARFHRNDRAGSVRYSYAYSSKLLNNT